MNLKMIKFIHIIILFHYPYHILIILVITVQLEIKRITNQINLEIIKIMKKSIKSKMHINKDYNLDYYLYVINQKTINFYLTIKASFFRFKKAYLIGEKIKIKLIMEYLESKDLNKLIKE